MPNPYKTKISKGQQPLTSNERVGIYLEIMSALSKLEIWDLNDESMKKFRIMVKLYVDYGMEFSGELDIERVGRRLIYNLYNDRNKKTVAYLSQDRYFKAVKEREKKCATEICPSLETP